MKTCGIVAEYNPFHNGHALLLKHAKKKLGADKVIIIMSGDHVQRGEPAMFDKYARTEMALKEGADLVLELTVPFATGSAGYFASGAVSALLHTGVLDMLLFGSETGDIEILRQKAGAGADMAEISAIPPLPNDILGIEYLKALQALNGDHVKAHTLKREGAAYLDTVPQNGSASAAAIRKIILEDRDLSELTDYIPESCLEILKDTLVEKRPLSMIDYSQMLFYALMIRREEGYSEYFDIYDDLSDKMLKHLPEYESIADFATKLKSRDIAYTHICRAMLHLILGIKKDDVRTLINDYERCAYLKPLGFKKSSDDLLKAIKNNSDRPFISKAADASSILDGKAFELFKKDIFASDLYEKEAARKGGFISEYRKSLVVI